MYSLRIFTLGCFLLGVRGQASSRPANTAICDYYTAAILGSNTAANEELLMTLLVNTFVIGNYTTPNTGVAVAGIAGPAVYNGTQVALLPYFTGALNSTNEGGDSGISLLFLNDGGATPLATNKSSNGNVTSAQYHLLTHIYQYFGTLLGCSKQGVDAFPAYQGRTSMYEVHKYMNLDIYQNGYFVSQVAASAKSLGFASADVSILVNTLNKFFTRCAPATEVAGIVAPAELQSVCVAADCPLDPNANCSTYPDDGVAKIPTNVTSAATSSSSASGTSKTTTPSTVPASQGTAVEVGFGLGIVEIVVGALFIAWVI